MGSLRAWGLWPEFGTPDPEHHAPADVVADLEAEDIAVEGQRRVRVVVGEKVE